MGRYLGIDYGKKRIGLALSDIMGIMAQPFDVIDSKGLKNNIENIIKIIKEKEISCVVVGNPVNMNASEWEMSKFVMEFVEELKKVTDVKVEIIDERLTTAQAERVLIEEANVSREKRKTIRDKLAATFILQTYLDLHHSKI